VISVVAVAGIVGGLRIAGGPSKPPPPAASFGTTINQPFPEPTVPLVNEDGQGLTLGSFRGKYVVLAQFLTLCQEDCPLTTRVFQVLQASADRAGLSQWVVFVETTIDPQRDSPARLRAYQSEFGADWTLLTRSAANVAAFRKQFGIYYQKVPEGNPPGVDWWTHEQLTYDVNHTDGFILIDPSGNMRLLTQDLPYLYGKLPANLRAYRHRPRVDESAPSRERTAPVSKGAGAESASSADRAS
jgi:protein SCO1/2